MYSVSSLPLFSPASAPATPPTAAEGIGRDWEKEEIFFSSHCKRPGLRLSKEPQGAQVHGT